MRWQIKHARMPAHPLSFPRHPLEDWVLKCSAYVEKELVLKVMASLLKADTCRLHPRSGTCQVQWVARKRKEGQGKR